MLTLSENICIQLCKKATFSLRPCCDVMSCDVIGDFEPITEHRLRSAVRNFPENDVIALLLCYRIQV